MAKLNGVTPVMDVEVDGIKYRKVERKAQAGDIVKVISSDYDLQYGGFYPVVEGPGVVDDVNDLCKPFEKYPEDFKVYEKVAEPSPAPQPERLKVGEYAKVISEDPIDGSSPCRAVILGSIHKITDDDGSKTPYWMTRVTDGEISVSKAERLVRATDAEVAAAKKSVERTKAIGEFADGGYAVIIRKNPYCMHGFSNGDYVVVTPKSLLDGGRSALTIKDAKGSGGFCNADALRKITREEYEEATKPKPEFNVGDHAKVVRDVMEYRTGDVVKITSDNSTGLIGTIFDFKVDRVGKNTYGYINAKDIEKVPAEEAKWATIGRKVGELKDGDVVEFTKNTGALDYPKGSIAIIRNLHGNDFDFGDSYLGDTSWVKLVTPVEQRFDLSQGGASPSK
jgi:hypothetical protein